jgi:hypothetical protein
MAKISFNAPGVAVSQDAGAIAARWSCPVPLRLLVFVMSDKRWAVSPIPGEAERDWRNEALPRSRPCQPDCAAMVEHWSKIVSDRSAWLRSWNLNLALNILNRAGFTLRPKRRDLGKMIQSEAILL